MYTAMRRLLDTNTPRFSAYVLTYSLSTELVLLTLPEWKRAKETGKFLTCQRLIFRRYREPASENVTSQREKEMRKIVTSERSTRNTSTQLSDR